MPSQSPVTAYDIGPFDRITLYESEVKLLMDGDHGKAFGGDHLAESLYLINARIKELLDHNDLVVERDFYNPKGSAARQKTPYLRGIPEHKQSDVVWRLEWVTRLAVKHAQRGRILSDDHMPAIMDEICREYTDEHAQAKVNETFGKTKIHRKNLPVLARPDARTLRGWYKAYRESGNDWRSLLDFRGTGLRESKFNEEELNLQGLALKRYLSSTKPNAAYIFRVMKAVERRINRSRKKAGMALFDLGSRANFYNRVADLPDIGKYIAHHGEAKAIAYYSTVIGKDHGYPMDLLEGDECRIDLVTLLDKGLNVWNELSPEEQEAYRKASVRFWFSAVVDHATDAFVAFRIHHKAPCVDTALATLELTSRDKTHIAKAAGCKSDWPFYGGLRRVRLDAAGWNTSDRVTATLTDAGATKVHAIAKSSFLRGTIERIFETINSLTLQGFSGRTFSSIVERGDQNPKKGASVNRAMLEKVFLRAIVDVHHNVRHGGKLGGMTPRQAWMIGAGQKKPPFPATGHLRRNIFGINLKRVITREGIRFLGFYFQSDAIQAMRRNKTNVEVDIRVDLDDLFEITVFDGAETHNVPSSLKLLRGMSYWKATALLEELDLIDTAYTKRTEEQVDDAILFIDEQPEIARVAYGVSSPLVTQEIIDKVESKIRRGLKISPETEYTQRVREQDWSCTPWLADSWGLNDTPPEDDLDVPSSESEAAIEAKYGAPVKKARKNAPKAAKAPPGQSPVKTTDKAKSGDVPDNVVEDKPTPTAKYRKEF